MSGFAQLLLKAAAGDIRAAIAADLRTRARRAALRGSVLLGALVLLAVAVAMAAWAAYLALLAVWAPPVAALVAAGGALVIAAILATLAFTARPAPAPAAASRRDATAEDIDAVAAQIAELGERMHREAGRHGESLVVAALTAGIVVSLMRGRR